MRFLMIVGDPSIAAYVSAHGVDRLFVDLEYLGKMDRQGHVESWKSHHGPGDVSRIRRAAPSAHLLVRVNPLHEGTRAELDEVIDRGADSVMLPMFRTCAEIEAFFELVDGRVEVVPLFETVGSLDALPEILRTLPLRDVHIGLNDLHLELRYDFMFEAFSSGILEEPCRSLRRAGVSFGIGGIARAHEGIISPQYLLGEHVRLGSDAAILSRTFHRGAADLAELQAEMDFASEVRALHEIHDHFLAATSDMLEHNRRLTADRINDVVELIRSRRHD